MTVRKVTVKDVCDFVGGSQPPKDVFISEYKEGYVRLVQTRDYKTDDFPTYIPIAQAKKFCNKQDIMIGRYGPPIFQICRGIEGAYNVALMKAVPKANILNDYLYYLLKQESILTYVDRLSLRTGGQTGVDLYSLNQYPVLLPDLPYQQSVINVLKSLDDKIELNNRINAELEAMIKTLYDYWFFQFDFPDKDGKPYKSSGGKMVWREELKREIPNGWNVFKLRDVLETSLGGTPPTSVKAYWENGTINWLNSGEVANFPVVDSELKITEAAIHSSASELLPKGTTLLSITRHLRPTVLAIDACANQSVVGIKEKGDIKYFFIYPYLKNEIRRLLTLRTGAQQPHINKQIVDDSLIVIPDEKTNTLKLYNSQVGSVYEQIINNSFQNQRLAELRDWLLPMLMNGQVTVKGKEAAVG